MKKISILFLSIFLIGGFLVGTQAWAEEDGEVVENGEVVVDEEVTAEDLEVSDPLILPNNPLYVFKDLWRGVRAGLTFNPIKKAELRLQYANKRLIEAKKLAEKTGKEKIVLRAMEKYQKEMQKVKDRVEKFKEKAEDNPKIDKFLDKFTDKSLKHQRLMDLLEEKLADKPEALERIRKVKEKTLEHFGEVMMRLEDKDKIQKRLEENLDDAKGGKYKNFKNLEVLMRVEEMVPEEAKEAIKHAQESVLRRLHGDLEQMSPEHQEKFGDYLDKVSGDQGIHLEIINKLRKKKASRVLRSQLEEGRREVRGRVEDIRKNLLQLCPEKPSWTSVEVLRECIKEKKQTRAGERNEDWGDSDNNDDGDDNDEKARQGIICPMLWSPVCGQDGKTYGNSCLAKAANTEITHRGKCEMAGIKAGR